MNTYVSYNKKSNNNHGATGAFKIKELWTNKNLIYKELNEFSTYEELFKSIAPDDEVVLCGGDGTLNFLVNEVDCETVPNPIYYYPTGTGNDFWNDLGKKAGDAPAKINQYLVKLPKVTVNGVTRKFINGIGYGIDGYCCEEGDKQRAEFGGKEINYTAIAIKGLLFHYKPTHAKVTVDGVTTEYDRCWLAPTMNGRFYGGGMMATPTIFKGEHVNKTKIVSITTGKKVHVEFDRPVALQIDGETVLNVKEYFVETASAE